MRKTSKVIATLVTLIFTFVVMMIPVSADTSKQPYVRSWLDAMNNYEVLDYYEYNSSEGGYMKTSVVQYTNGSAYYKTSGFVLTNSLYDEQIGFDINGNVYFIDTQQNIYVCNKNSNSVQNVANGAKELSYDSNGFVNGFYTINGSLSSFSNNYNGNNNNNNNNGWNNGNNNNNNNNNSWNNGNNNNNNNNNGWNNGNNNNNNNNNGWNNGNNNNNNNGWNNGNNNNNNSSSKYPFLAVEDGMLTYVEASDLRHTLYVENDHLMLNNIILYKHGVKAFAFTRDGVVYITKDSKLVYLKFGTKKQYVKAKKVSSLQFDNSGFCTGYTNTSGKSYSL